MSFFTIIYWMNLIFNFARRKFLMYFIKSIFKLKFLLFIIVVILSFVTQYLFKLISTSALNLYYLLTTLIILFYLLTIFMFAIYFKLVFYIICEVIITIELVFNCIIFYFIIILLFHYFIPQIFYIIFKLVRIFT